jgi:hypothetical protein
MKRKTFLIITFSFVVISLSYSQITPLDKGMKVITPEILKAQLGFLASDWTEGRMIGEKGESLSADYIASMLLLYGVKPAGDQLRIINTAGNNAKSERTFFQNFTLLKTQPVDEQIFKVRSADGKMTRSTDFTFNVDFTVRPSDPGFEIDAPVVFVGYGLRNEKLKINDFEKLDVKGKFILRLSGIPGFLRKSLTPAEIEKIVPENETVLKSMGVIGIIDFNPVTNVVGSAEKQDFLNISTSEGTPRTGKPSASYSIPGNRSSDNLIRLTVSAKAANEILKGTGIVLDDYLTKANQNESAVIPQINDKSVYLKTTVKTSQVAVKNIIGVIEGTNPDQVIVLGAHYDHMGMGNGFIWNGADDNGSGTVAVMTIAKAIIETGIKPEKTIIIALWTAEEEGLLGSKYWVQNPTVPLNNVKLNVNFDMISRYISENEPKKVTMTYTISNPGFRDITASNLKKYGIDISMDYQPSDNPPGGTDHRSFVAVGIPVLRFKPGHREEYHTPNDELSTIDWDIMEKIVKISFADVWELANTGW